ncbi:MAG: CoB--CoM heterodisulfide reductase iron-sulfur subunit B family protein [Chloroflexota bacterium]|nr:CoB--CoM heterodisulfide reductase iron-sulfur subunit B family protein [Chloroflexota bacterium]
MKYYSYFPGCSSSDGGAEAYGRSSQAVAKALDMELIELEDWNCCGSTPYSSIDDLVSLGVAARNLALAEKRGLDLVTPCSACYVVLGKANSAIKEYPYVKAEVDEALAAGGLEYHGTVKVRHLFEVMVNEVDAGDLSAKVERKLGGLRVAPYYGCQLVRPGQGFDDPEYPQSLDKLVECTGATATPFSLKSRCCGGSLIIPEEDIALGLINKLLHSASDGGAECVVTVCPLCQTNLDVYQAKVNKKFKTHYRLPVLFFTQLLGLAMGMGTKELGIDKGIVPADEVLSRYA